MGKTSQDSPGWLARQCGRHPLFAVALVAAVCVLTTACSIWLAAPLGLLFAATGWRFVGWKTGLAWALCGFLATGVYLARTRAAHADEQVLLAFPGGEIHGRMLKDAKQAGMVWRGIAVLESGPRPGAKVWWEGGGEIPVAGARVTARGNFSPLQAARNPGEFDQAGWLRGQGVCAAFRAGWVDGEVSTGRWAAFGAWMRRGFRLAITDGLDETSQEAAVIRAIVIGEPPPDAEELVAAFRNSGTLHAFSVSGLHVAMAGAIGWWVLRMAGVSRRRAVLLLLPMIFGYSWITGNSPPAVRSAWMAAVFLCAFVTRRRPDLLNSLGAVLLAAALWDGRLLFLPGVQLSYGVVAAIAIGVGLTSRIFTWMALPPLYLPRDHLNRWQKFWWRLRQKTAQSLGVSVAAAVGSTPLTAWHFGLVTPVSILAGVVMVPLVFALLAAALFAAAFHPALPALSRQVNRANGWIAKSCTFTAEKFAAIPGGHFQIRPERKPFLLVYDLDHGAGAACFSGGDGSGVLLDCADLSQFKRRLAPSLRRLGVTPDSVVLSHPDGGHLGGGAQVWEAFQIRQALLPVEKARSPALDAWAEDAPKAGIRTLQAAAISGLPLPDGARLEILHVPDPHQQHAIADERVCVFRLHWRGWKLLFTSDAGVGTEQKMLASGRDLQADVIIAGRHRTDLSLGDRFLDAVRPQAIVASHADFPVAEKLDPGVVAFWKSRGIRVIHQGLSGGVTLRGDDDGNLRLEGFADKSVTVLKRR